MLFGGHPRLARSDPFIYHFGGGSEESRFPPYLLPCPPSRLFLELEFETPR